MCLSPTSSGPVLCTAFMALATGCAREAPSANDAYVVQITRSVHAPDLVHCGDKPTQFLFLFNVTMVNTTAAPVSLQRVKVSGQYLSAGLVGQAALSYDAAPFTPLSLRAHDGEGLTTVSLGGTCPPLSQYGEIYVTLNLMTETGSYATTPVRLSFVY